MFFDDSRHSVKIGALGNGCVTGYGIFCTSTTTPELRQTRWRAFTSSERTFCSMMKKPITAPIGYANAATKHSTSGGITCSADAKSPATTHDSCSRCKSTVIATATDIAPMARLALGAVAGSRLSVAIQKTNSSKCP